MAAAVLEGAAERVRALVPASTSQLTWKHYAAALGLAVGAVALKRLVGRIRLVSVGRRSGQQLRVVVTGSTKGIGYALARKFLASGDRVVVTSRSQARVDRVVSELALEFGVENVFGVAGSVSSYEDMEALAKFAKENMGGVDAWVNNAGCSQDDRLPMHETSPGVLRRIMETNVLGTLYSTKAATNLILTQSERGHVFNMEGAGSGGRSTRLLAAYGFSKGGFRQLTKTLVSETKGTNVGIHLVSPGMVITDLLMANAKSPMMCKIMNTLAEQRETVADWMVPRIRGTVLTDSGSATNHAYRYLTMNGAMLRFFTHGILRGTLFGNDRLGLKKWIPEDAAEPTDK